MIKKTFLWISARIFYSPAWVRVCPKCKSIYAEEVKFCGIDGERLVEQDTDPLLGHTLDRYTIIERLGAGAMGVVYRAKHSVLETEFAVKVLFGEHGANETVTKRFRREAQAISKIKHPNIVSIVDFGIQDGGLSYLVMELVEGFTLQDIIYREAPMTVDRAMLLARHIAEGLAEAHHHGFVHRDLKPGNIIVEKKRRGEFAKILDFGLVTITDSESSQTRLTKTGHTVGTPAYMAPEQTRSSKVQPTADLYSLGVIIYEMLTGHLPFDGETAEVLLQKCLEQAPQLPAYGGIGNVSNRLIERDPSARFQTAQETVSALDELLHASGASLSGLHNSPVSSGGISHNSLSNPSQPFAPPSAFTPDSSRTSTGLKPEVSPFSEADALARTTPSQRIRTNNYSSTAELPSPKNSFPRWLLAVAVLFCLSGAAWFFALPSGEVTSVALEVERPAKMDSNDMMPEPEPPPPMEPVKMPDESTSTAPMEEMPSSSDKMPEETKEREANSAPMVEKRDPPRPMENKSPEKSAKPDQNSNKSVKKTKRKDSKRREVKKRKVQKAEVQKAEVQKAEVSKPVPVKPGRLQIKGITWWDVHLNGRKEYRHPARPKELAPGKHRVALHNFNCSNSPIRMVVTIKSGEKTKISPKCESE